MIQSSARSTGANPRAATAQRRGAIASVPALAAVLAVAVVMLSACGPIEKRPGLLDFLGGSSLPSVDVATVDARQVSARQADPRASETGDAVDQLASIVARVDAEVLAVRGSSASAGEALANSRAEWGAVGAGAIDGQQRGPANLVLFRRDRWDLDEWGTMWLSENPSVPGSISWGAGETRTATWARLRHRSSGLRLRVYSVELDDRSVDARERSAELLARHLAMGADLAVLRPAAQGERTIVAGGFNDNERGRTMRFLRGSSTHATRDQAPSASASSAAPGFTGLVEVFRDAHPDSDRPRTTPGRFDAILIDRGLVVERAEIGELGPTARVRVAR